MNSVPVGSEPAQIICPSCNIIVVTKVERKATNRTHIAALCLFCCLCWPCTCLPYCMNSCRNADHYCPNCNTYIGTYHR